MTTFATLCHVKKDNKILLQKKSKGLFGGGKYNAPGGKLKDNESPEKCAIREVFEETGLRVNKLEKIGELIFYTSESPSANPRILRTHVSRCEEFPIPKQLTRCAHDYTDKNEAPDWVVHVFLATHFSGKLKNNYLEGELEWFDIDNLPYDEMWEDDRLWVPLLLQNKKFIGTFYFSKNFEKLIDYKIDVDTK